MPDPSERTGDTYRVTDGYVYHDGDKLGPGAQFHPTHRQVAGGTLVNKAEKVGDAPARFDGADIGLRSLDWGSEAALKLALDAGLSTDDFDGREPSGATGYVKSDVEGVLEAR